MEGASCTGHFGEKKIQIKETPVCIHLITCLYAYLNFVHIHFSFIIFFLYSAQFFFFLNGNIGQFISYYQKTSFKYQPAGWEVPLSHL